MGGEQPMVIGRWIQRKDGRRRSLAERGWATAGGTAGTNARPGSPCGNGRRGWTEALIWADTARAVARLDLGGTPRVHSCDRGADRFDFLHCCPGNSATTTSCARWMTAKPGRTSGGGRDWPGKRRRFPRNRRGPPAGHGQRAHGHRPARLAVRFAPIAAPRSTTRATRPVRRSTRGPMDVREDHPPAGSETVEWMLLTTLAVTGAAPARVVIGHDRQRWQIEAWHRGPKQGCALESARLKTRAAPSNLAALLGVVAVRLLQLRDLARDPADRRSAGPGAPADPARRPRRPPGAAGGGAFERQRLLVTTGETRRLAGPQKRPAARLARSLAGLAAPRPPRPRRRPVRSST